MKLEARNFLRLIFFSFCRRQVVIIESDNGHQGGGAGVIGPFGLEEYFEVEDDSSSSKRGKGKKGRKHKKKGKKIFKKMQPMLIGLGAMKLIFYHLFLKKLAIVTFFTFLLSKVSFILATLVALKQFFHTPTQHRSHDSDKLEVVHIPIRKHRYKEEKDKDSYYDESKFIPITFAPDTVYDTTPFYYDFPFNEHNPESFASSEDGFDANFDGKFSGKFKGDLNENFKDNLNENFNDNTNDDFNDIYNEHFESFKKKPSSAADKSDDYNEKNFYKNHVHSPFI